MPRGRRNNYNYYYPQRSLTVGKRNKYSSITTFITNGSPTAPDFKWYFTIVNPTNVEGMRKVKNISIQLAFNEQYTDPENGTVQFTENQQFLWAIVYVPKGSEPGEINPYVNGVLYSPPQFIMASGIYDTNQPGNSSRIYTPLSRNLNPGDGIAFVYKPVNSFFYTQQLKAVINYAITLQ